MTIREIGKKLHGKEPERPTPPPITNKEALDAQKELQKLLNREDIITNALPDKESSPLIVFIHGYLSSKWLWLDPFFGSFGWIRDHRNEPKPRSYGWHPTPTPGYMFAPFDVSSSPLTFPEGLFPFLMRKGFEAVTYSQIDTTGDITISAKELGIILKGIKKIYGKRRIMLIAHSRGGICARKYLSLDSTKETNIEKIITLSSPHGGTNLSKAPMLKQPAINVLNRFETIKRLWDVSGKRQIRELTYEQMAPNSEFLAKLNDIERWPEISYITVAGKSPVFANVYTWSAKVSDIQSELQAIFKLEQIKETITKASKVILPNETVEKVFAKKSMKNDGPPIKQTKEVVKEGKRVTLYHWVAYPTKLLSLFDRGLFPELQIGDGVVSAKSALLAQAERKFTFDTNHFEVAVCKQVKELVQKELKNLTENKD